MEPGVEATLERGERARNAWRIALSTFTILALELALIRWMSQQVRLFAYLNNVLLMSAFLGMGLGLGIGRRRPALIHATLPLLAVLSALLGFSGELGLMRLALPDPSLFMWGSNTNVTFAASTVKVLLLIALVVAVFVCAASLLGNVFGRYGDTLGAYSWDLIGSLTGIVAMTILAAFNTPPPLWFLIAAAPLLWLSPRWTSWVTFAAVIVFTILSIRGAAFSPYNRLDLWRDGSRPLNPLLLAANRDAHQYLFDFSPRSFASAGLSERDRFIHGSTEIMYRLPFLLSPHKRTALVVGAGTGNDVAAALRAGFQHVVAVEIDPVIYRIGREKHPEMPYRDPRVEVVISDARTFFERSRDRRFDMICFGLLDSHAMFSAMSSLRLDNYVYTTQALQSAFGLLSDGGLLSVSFSVAGGPWISERITALLRAATRQEPLVLDFSRIALSHTWLVGRNVNIRSIAQQLQEIVLRTPQPGNLRIPTDDWPFLYLRPSTFPTALTTVLAGLLLVAAIGARAVYGETFFTWKRFSGSFFFLGAAFLLIETRGVTNLSLLFGSTWIVNSAVFGGILLSALAANVLVQRVRILQLEWLFAGLSAVLLVNYFVPPGAFLRFSPGVGGTLAALVNGAPVAFAGVIFSTLLRQSSDPAAALGWNLLGAVFGGCLEYLSMATGLRALVLLALVLYGITMLVILRAKIAGVRLTVPSP